MINQSFHQHNTSFSFYFFVHLKHSKEWSSIKRIGLLLENSKLLLWWETPKQKVDTNNASNIKTPKQKVETKDCQTSSLKQNIAIKCLINIICKVWTSTKSSLLSVLKLFWSSNATLQVLFLVDQVYLSAYFMLSTTLNIANILFLYIDT